jgi:hypothetical protein
MAFRWPDTQWGNRDTAVFKGCSGMLECPGDSGSGYTYSSGQLGSALDETIIQHALPI